MKYIHIDQLQVGYEEVGVDNGKPVVLLHGWGSDLHAFRHIVKNLETGFHVYALDFPGFGESDEPNEAWGVGDYTAFLKRFLEQMHVENPILVGHSFGGRVGIVYAAKYLLHKLILFDAAGIKPKRKLSYYVKVYSFKLYKKILPLLVGRKQANQQIENYRKKAGSTDYNNASGLMRKILVRTVNEDLKRFMPDIKAPTLLIWGEDDHATPVKDGKLMEKLIKGSGLVVLKNAGHFSFIDKIYETNAILDSFLEEDKTPAAPVS